MAKKWANKKEAFTSPKPEEPSPPSSPEVDFFLPSVPYRPSSSSGEMEFMRHMGDTDTVVDGYTFSRWVDAAKSWARVYTAERDPDVLYQAGLHAVIDAWHRGESPLAYAKRMAEIGLIPMAAFDSFDKLTLTKGLLVLGGVSLTGVVAGALWHHHRSRPKCSTESMTISVTTCET